MTTEQMQAEIARLTKLNDALKAKAAAKSVLTVSTGKKGGHFRRNRWVPVLTGQSAGTR